MNFAVLSLVLLGAFLCNAQSGDDYEVGIEMVGCFKDVKTDRALPDLYANVRSKIDWNNMNETVKQCADEADHKGYRWFGVQFYGECWSGPAAEVTYNKYGMSKNCWNGVGQHDTNAVYRFYMRRKSKA